MTYGKDLRTLVITYRNRGSSLVETATALDIAIRTVTRIRRCSRNYDVVQNPFAMFAGRRQKCTDEIIEVLPVLNFLLMQYIRDTLFVLKSNYFYYLQELWDELEIAFLTTISMSSLCRCLKMNISRKIIILHSNHPASQTGYWARWMPILERTPSFSSIMPHYTTPKKLKISWSGTWIPSCIFSRMCPRWDGI